MSHRGSVLGSWQRLKIPYTEIKRNTVCHTGLHSSFQQPNFTLGRVERSAVLPRVRARRRRVARVAQLRVGGRDCGRVVAAQQPLAPG